ncbi:MAG: DNA polymerase/3'-5' exonuclease PolX [Desulfurella sp.]|uniref:DNA polymerase/3'-5' exonuclease PolX n=1 Tax=Desulfurella sp. TaxID=1962857 RepID=UPI000CC0B612|nr:DNA polymerase/3'-5' exonuclease PolX [Desulfurella sp.]PMP87249.1 MAG: DNA polymerase/3'-5' exonuclease PolX [Desulfurella sp.]
MKFQDNEKIASIFETIADALEFLNENAFKIRAYRNAAESIRNLNESITEIYSKPNPKKIEGVGKDLEQKIKEYIQTQKVAYLDELLEKVPYTLFRLKDIRGLGPRTLYKIFEKYRVRTLEDIKKLVFENDELKDISLLEKSIKKIREGIQLYEEGQSRFPLGVAYPIAKDLVDRVYKIDNVKKVEIAGSVRRGKETVGDLDILICTKDFNSVSKALANLEHKQIIAMGDTKVSLLLSNNMQVDFRLVNEDSFASALQYFSGSKEHNVRLRDIAIKKGFKLNEYGLFEKDKKIETKTEEDIYNALGLCYIKPTLRENKGEIEACLANKLPNVVELGDIKGDLHVHTNYSDGLMSLEEVIQEAIKRNYDYIAITDHSVSSYVANGLSVERLYDQLNEIDKLKDKYKGKIHILAGSEVDIKQNGELDFSDNVLKDLDIVIASIHQGFANSKEINTKRIISAIENPYVNIIAHPTGRLIGQRAPYEIDIQKIAEYAAKHKTALEINSFYLRLDLNDEHARLAKNAGAKICINTDTHTKENLDYMIYGVLTAQRGWIEKSDCLNTLNYSQLKQFLKKH